LPRGAEVVDHALDVGPDAAGRARPEHGTGRADRLRRVAERRDDLGRAVVVPVKVRHAIPPLAAGPFRPGSHHTILTAPASDPGLARPARSGASPQPGCR